MKRKIVKDAKKKGRNKEDAKRKAGNKTTGMRT